MLEVTGLSAGYGGIVAARDFSFSVGSGETLTSLAPTAPENPPP